jgi:hypothetical protein
MPLDGTHTLRDKQWLLVSRKIYKYMLKKVILLFFALSLFPTSTIFAIDDEEKQSKRSISTSPSSGALYYEESDALLTSAQKRSLNVDRRAFTCMCGGIFYFLTFCLVSTILWNKFFP